MIYDIFTILLYAVALSMFPFVTRGRQSSVRVSGWLRIPYVFSSFFVRSLSLREIVIMSLSSSDRAGFIKEYYDFKHKNISSVIKGISSVIVLNLGVLVKNNFDMGLDKKHYNQNDYLLLMLTVALIAFNIYYVSKLNGCVKEFSKAVKIYELLK